ncbi:MAG: YfgM family protein [Arsenophonus sp. ER-LPS3-MAG3]
MNINTSENEKINTIRRFIINNIKVLVVLLVTGIVLIISLYYWRSYQENSLQESVETFEEISSQLQIGSKQSIYISEQFANETNNIYAALTNIQLAKLAVEKNNIIDAEKALLRALKKAKLDNFKNLINIRLARVQLALNKIDKAFVSLIQVHDKELSAIIENIRGDAFLKKGDISSARSAYSKGIESNGNEMIKTILKIKINKLSN